MNARAKDVAAIILNALTLVHDNNNPLSDNSVVVRQPLLSHEREWVRH